MNQAYQNMCAGMFKVSCYIAISLTKMNSPVILGSNVTFIFTDCLLKNDLLSKSIGFINLFKILNICHMSDVLN